MAGFLGIRDGSGKKNDLKKQLQVSDQTVKQELPPTYHFQVSQERKKENFYFPFQ